MADHVVGHFSSSVRPSYRVVDVPDPTPTPPTPTAEERIAELEAVIAALVGEAP